MTMLAVLLIGHSVFSALTLAWTHLRAEPYREAPLARAAGLVLLLALAGLQLAHLAWLQFDVPATATPLYRATLFVVAPAFWLFSRPVLLPQAENPVPWVLALHGAPALLGAALPGRVFVALYAGAIGLAFVLVQLALGLRPQLPAEVRDSARAAYTSTTLARVDCDDALARLQALVLVSCPADN